MNIGKTNAKHFNTVVIGGGAAGMMAAISASQNGAKVVLLEKNQSLGKKLLLTGNGRCNLTQSGQDTRGFMEKIGRNGKFLFSSLPAFGPKETIEFFENSGLKIKTGKNGRAFPVSDKAQDVLDILKKILRKNGVKIMYGRKVLVMNAKDGKIDCVETEKEKIYADSFILATGGKSYPATGSTGDGYSWLARIGHKINSPAPALTPIKIKELWIKSLQGISLRNAGLTLIQNGRRVNLGSGEVLFTHFGLSGPAVINASRIIGKYLKQDKVFLEIDLLPKLKLAELEEKLKREFETRKKRDLKNYLTEYFPQKIAGRIIELSGLEAEIKIYSLSKSDRKNLAILLKGVPATVDSLLDFNHAMTTSGGVDLKEVNPKTMNSKIVDNLFLVGEILDLDGPTGGYNLQIAWTTGYTAGKYAR